MTSNLPEEIIKCFRIIFDDILKAHPLTVPQRVVYNHQIENCEVALNEFLDNENFGTIVLFGEAGRGKSWELVHYTNKLYKEYEQGKLKGFPLFLQGRFVEFESYSGRAMDEFKNFIVDYRSQRIHGNAKISKFDLAEFLRTNDIILILDGYDELERKREKEYPSLRQLLSPCRFKNLKTIIGSRKEILKGEEDVEVVTKAGCSSLNDLFHGLGGGYDVLNLIPFGHAQVDDYLVKFVKNYHLLFRNNLKFDVFKDTDGKVDKKTYQNVLKNVPGLKKLCSNALMMSLIFMTLPKIRGGLEGGRGELSREGPWVEVARLTLFKEITEAWFLTQAERIQTLGVFGLHVGEKEILKTLRVYSKNLSRLQFRRGRMKRFVTLVDARDTRTLNGAPKIVREMVQKDTSYELIDHIRSSCLIDVNKNHFVFHHNSIVEYFAMECCVSEIKGMGEWLFRIEDPRDKMDEKERLHHRDSFFTVEITSEIGVLRLLVEKVKECLRIIGMDCNELQKDGILKDYQAKNREPKNLVEWLFRVVELSKFLPNLMSIGAANALTILCHSRVSFGGMKFRGITARNVDFRLAILDRTDFSYSDLTGSRFRKCYMHLTNFDGCCLRNCEFDTERNDAIGAREGYGTLKSFSQNGRYLAVAVMDNYSGDAEVESLLIEDLEEGVVVFEWKEKQSVFFRGRIEFYKMCFVPSGELVFYNGADILVVFGWDHKKGFKFRETISIPNSHYSYEKIDNDNFGIAYSSEFHEILLWTVYSTDKKNRPLGTDAKMIVIFGVEGGSVDQKKELTEFNDYFNEGLVLINLKLRSSFDGERVVVFVRSGFFVIYDSSGNFLRSLSYQPSSKLSFTSDCGFFEKNRFFYFNEHDYSDRGRVKNKFRYFDLDTEKCHKILSLGGGKVLSISPQNDYFLCYGENSIEVKKLSSQEVIGYVPESIRPIFGGRVVSGTFQFHPFHGFLVCDAHPLKIYFRKEVGLEFEPITKFVLEEENVNDINSLLLMQFPGSHLTSRHAIKGIGIGLSTFQDSPIFVFVNGWSFDYFSKVGKECSIGARDIFVRDNHRVCTYCDSVGVGDGVVFAYLCHKNGKIHVSLSRFDKKKEMWEEERYYDCTPKDFSTEKDLWEFPIESVDYITKYFLSLRLSENGSSVCLLDRSGEVKVLVAGRVFDVNRPRFRFLKIKKYNYYLAACFGKVGDDEEKLFLFNQTKNRIEEWDFLGKIAKKRSFSIPGPKFPMFFSRNESRIDIKFCNSVLSSSYVLDCREKREVDMMAIQGESDTDPNYVVQYIVLDCCGSNQPKDIRMKFAFGLSDRNIERLTKTKGIISKKSDGNKFFKGLVNHPSISLELKDLKPGDILMKYKNKNEGKYFLGINIQTSLLTQIGQAFDANFRKDKNMEFKIIHAAIFRGETQLIESSGSSGGGGTVIRSMIGDEKVKGSYAVFRLSNDRMVVEKVLMIADAVVDRQKIEQYELGTKGKKFYSFWGALGSVFYNIVKPSKLSEMDWENKYNKILKEWENGIVNIEKLEPKRDKYFCSELIVWLFHVASALLGVERVFDLRTGGSHPHALYLALKKDDKKWEYVGNFFNLTCDEDLKKRDEILSKWREKRIEMSKSSQEWRGNVSIIERYQAVCAQKRIFHNESRKIFDDFAARRKHQDSYSMMVRERCPPRPRKLKMKYSGKVNEEEEEEEEEEVIKINNNVMEEEIIIEEDVAEKVIRDDVASEEIRRSEIEKDLKKEEDSGVGEKLVEMPDMPVGVGVREKGWRKVGYVSRMVDGKLVRHELIEGTRKKEEVEGGEETKEEIEEEGEPSIEGARKKEEEDEGEEETEEEIEEGENTVN